MDANLVAETIAHGNAIRNVDKVVLYLALMGLRIIVEEVLVMLSVRRIVTQVVSVLLVNLNVGLIALHLALLVVECLALRVPVPQFVITLVSLNALLVHSIVPMNA